MDESKITVKKFKEHNVYHYIFAKPITVLSGQTVRTSFTIDQNGQITNVSEPEIINFFEEETMLFLPGLMDIHGNLRFYNIKVKEENDYGVLYEPIYFDQPFAIDAILHLNMETQKINVYPVDRTKVSPINGRCFYDLIEGDQLNLTVEYKTRPSVAFAEYMNTRF